MYTKTRLGKIVNLVRLGIEISLILSISILSMYASCLAGQGEIALVNPVWKGILKQTWPEVRVRGTFQACEETVSSYDEFRLALIKAMRSRQPNVTIYFDPNKSYDECIKWNDRFWGPSSSSEPTDSDLFQEIPWLYWAWTNFDWDWFYDVQGFVTTIIYNISYRYGPDEEKALERGLLRILEQIVFPDMDMFTREKTLHDWIVNHVDYDKATLNGSDDLGYTDYSAFIRGLAVCAGYSTLAYRMLSMAGIPDLIVHGNVTSSTSHHAWNMVNLCGNWYHLDVTWDDYGQYGDTTVYYDYFNLSDGQISVDHTWDSGNYPIANSIFNESVCLGKIEHRCSIFEPELCDTELKCIRISGNWCGTYCETVSYPMVISPSELEVDVGATKTATATDGTVPYAVISSDSFIATATVSDSTITIKGVTEGKCTITVSDSSSPVQTAEIPVTVTKTSSQPPIIDSFTANLTLGNAPLTVSFTCTAIDIDGTIALYKWDFDGDGNVDQITSDGTVIHTYNTSGTYNAKVTVVDNDGARVVSDPITITVTGWPTHYFCPQIDPPSVHQVGFYNQDLAEAPLKVSGDELDVCFNYTGPVNILAGVLSDDFKHIWWLKPDCSLDSDYSQAVDSGNGLSCEEISMPVEGGYLFWLVSPVDLSHLDWENGIYELLFYQVP